jgi:hypothetical protein
MGARRVGEFPRVWNINQNNPRNMLKMKIWRQEWEKYRLLT